MQAAHAHTIRQATEYDALELSRLAELDSEARELTAPMLIGERAVNSTPILRERLLAGLPRHCACGPRKRPRREEGGAPLTHAGRRRSSLLRVERGTDALL